jgi:hypothetical protein
MFNWSAEYTAYFLYKITNIIEPFRIACLELQKNIGNMKVASAAERKFQGFDFNF